MLLADLHRWLLRAFNAAELRRVVRFGPAGEQVAASLPENCSLDEMAFEAVLAWDRQGVIGKALLRHLGGVRPHRLEEPDLAVKKNLWLTAPSNYHKLPDPDL